MELPVLIFAGNYNEAKTYAHSKALGHGRWFFVSGPEKLQGICQPPNSVKAPCIGSFWERDDAGLLYLVAKSYGIALVETPII